MIPDQIYDDVLAAVSTVGADVTSDCERFLTEMVKNYTGDKGDIARYIREHVVTWFKAVDAYPEWIQNADWQFHQGRPMVFIGQIPIPKSSELFHDDAIVFVFLSDDGTMRNVIQVA